MGTLATESYIRLVNRETHAHSDQEFLDYVVFNDAAVPDRTAFIIGQSDDDPFPIIADDIDKATAMGASFIVLEVTIEEKVMVLNPGAPRITSTIISSH